MAYLRGYDFDIFISYARLDNTRELKQSQGWVDYFKELLQLTVMRKLESRRDALTIHFDKEEINYQTDDFIDKAKRSALFLIISSPSYYDPARFAINELHAFLSTQPSLDRVFVAECLPLASKTGYPTAISKALRIAFHNEKGRPFSLTEESGRFEETMWDLAERINQRINTFFDGPARGSAAAVAAASGYKRILLSQVTEDLEGDRAQLARYLSQFHLLVNPVSAYPTDGSEFARDFYADLENSDIFVQLLSPLSGRILSGMDQSYTMFQYNAAVHAGKEIIQWLKPGLEIANVENPAYRALLQSDSILVFGLQELMEHIKKAATIRAPEVKTKTRTNLSVFINADKKDLDLAREFQDAFASVNVMASLPLISDSDPTKITQDQRQDLEENLLDCDILIYIYRHAPVAWIRQQWRHFNKIRATRDKDPRIIAICVGSPDAKDRINMEFPLTHEFVVDVNQPDQIMKLVRDLVR